MLSTITELVIGSEQGKDIYLYNGNAADILFLFYLNLYQDNEIALRKGTALTANIYATYKQDAYALDYHNGIIGSVGVFQNLDKFEIANTDVSCAFKRIDSIILQKLAFGEVSSLSLENGILGYTLFLFNRMKKYEPGNSSLEQDKRYEVLILAIDELERHTKLPGTQYYDEHISFDENHIRDLGKAMLLLAKIKINSFYPELVLRTFLSIESYLNKLLNSDNNLATSSKFHVLYSMWQSNIVLTRNDESEGYLSKIYKLEFSGEEIDDEALTQIQKIQQFNRLYWSTADPYFSRESNRLIGSLMATLNQQETRLQQTGLAGIPGLGLCILSSLSKDCLNWDETLLLS